MADNLQQTIQEEIGVLSENEMREVLEFVNGLRNRDKSPQTLGKLIDECFAKVPPDVMNKLPVDASLNFDHYLYRARKK